MSAIHTVISLSTLALLTACASPGMPTSPSDAPAAAAAHASHHPGTAAAALTATVYGQGGGTKPMVYVSGLSAWLAAQGASYYDVVVYADGDAQASRTGEYWLMDASGPTR